LKGRRRDGGERGRKGKEREGRGKRGIGWEGKKVGTPTFWKKITPWAHRDVIFVIAKLSCV